LAADPPLDVSFTIAIAAGRIAKATVSSPQGRESPFSFGPAAAPFPFPIEVPAATHAPAEVAQGDDASKQAHQRVIAWVQAYGRTRAGGMPDHVDEATLRVEVVSSQGTWPTGAYDGKPLADQPAAGHFQWTKCGAN